MNTDASLPIVMLSGMAADERLFKPQLAQFPQLRVQPWITPRPDESIRSYAARLAKLADPRRPCLVGGASFGGIVAMEMATHLRALGCVLIGSIRTPTELPWRWRVLSQLGILGPDRLGILAGMLSQLGKGILLSGTVRRLHRLSKPEAAFVRWAICSLIRWRPRPTTRRIRVFHIHGASDQTLPVALTCPDIIVPTGGHALTLFSAGAVNEFLAEVVRDISEEITPALPSPRGHAHR